NKSPRTARNAVLLPASLRPNTRLTPGASSSAKFENGPNAANRSVRNLTRIPPPTREPGARGAAARRRRGARGWPRRPAEPRPGPRATRQGAWLAAHRARRPALRAPRAERAAPTARPPLARRDRRDDAAPPGPAREP